MATSAWLDLTAKLAEVVSAVAGVFALILQLLDKGKAKADSPSAFGFPARAPRGWLRLSAGLICIPLLALFLQLAGLVPTALYSGVEVTATGGALAAGLAFGLHMLRARRQRMPLPDALRTLLDRQWEDSQRHQYSYSVGSAPPLVEIYVDQLTEWLPSPSVTADVDRVLRLTLIEMFKQSRNAILLGNPGVGKSTAIAQVLRQQSSFWRDARRSAKPSDAPYGPSIPIALPADLYGCHSLSSAMARQWVQLTGVEVDPREFERKPPCGESWLVLMDGVDQILNTPRRTEILARIGSWGSNPASTHRFVITSRPLLNGELGPLKAEHFGRFGLHRFSVEDLGHFAYQWVAFRQAQYLKNLDAPPFTVDKFMTSIKAASLFPLARTPLIATITALILENDQETALPASRAGLYERFVLHLFSSRHLMELRTMIPLQFVYYGKPGQRGWTWLLDNLRDLLEGIADLHLSADSPAILDCAVKWVRSNAPAGTFEVISGWEDSLAGLLTAASLIVPGPGGLQFAHPNFAEYLAAGPRARNFDPETWLADARSPDSRSLALFVLARQVHETEAPPGKRLADTLADLLLERGGSDARMAGEIIADGIEVARELHDRIVDDLFEQLARDDLDAGEALAVLINLTTHPQVVERLARFADDSTQPDWVRADTAEELCAVIHDTGIQLFRRIFESTSDSLLQYRLLVGLDAHGEATNEERARVAQHESLPVDQITTSSGMRAGQRYRQIAEDTAHDPGQRLRALLAMAERRDPGWPELLAAVIISPALSDETRLDAARKVMQLAEPGGVEVLRRIADQDDHSLEVRVPLLAAMSEARIDWARQMLNQFAATGGEQFRERFPSISAWREEIGTRSSEQREEPVVSPRKPGAAPAIWGGVPQRNRIFTGREDVFTRLRHSLQEGTANAVAIVPSVPVLQGMGGVGKTALAIEYAHRYRSDYDLVWWIRADQMALVRSSLAALAEPLGLSPPTAIGIDAAVASVLDALRRGSPYSRWLLIFDNADQPKDLDNIIPRGPGHVLITSRNHRWEVVFDTVPIDVFARTESKEFLARRVPKKLSDAEADQLAMELGDLPLALEQAGAVQAETGMPVDEYLRQLREHLARIMEAEKSPDYPQSVTAAWRLSVDMLSKQLPQALELLRCCAFFSPEPIPRDVFRRGSQATGTRISDLIADPILLARAIRELARFALVRIDGRTILVHRLIQALLRDDLSPEEQASYQHEVHLILAGGAPKNPDDSRHWPRYAELLPHVASPVTGLAKCQDPGVRAFALEMVRYLYCLGDQQSSRAFAEHFIEEWTRESGPNDEAVLDARRHLGNALRELGQYAAAYTVSETTLRHSQEVLGDRSPLTLALRNSFSADLRARGDFAEARSLDEKSLDLHVQVYGSEDGQTLRAMYDLAFDYELKSDYVAARHLHQRTYLLRSEAVTGVSASEILTSWNGLARAVRLLGNYTEARDIGADAYDFGSEVLGAEHYWTLRTLNNTSIALRNIPSGQVDALDQAREVLSMCSKQFGDRSPDTLAASVTLINALRVSGRIDQALPLADTTMTLFRELYGPDHPYTCACSTNLAVLRRLAGDPTAARQLNELALAQLDAGVGRDHHYSLSVAANLASDLAELGESANAQKIGESTLAGLRNLMGHSHPMTLGCAANLVADRRAAGAMGKAEQLSAETLDHYADTLGTDHPNAIAITTGERINFDFDPPI